MRQLAYVGEDGQVRVLDLDLGQEREISAQDRFSTTDHAAVCSWPTWSPTGDRLAFFQYELAGTDVRAAVIKVAEADGSTVSEFYRLPRGGPIYMCWSPDGERLAVLVQEANELYLRVVDSHGQALTVAQGAPLYFAWEPDSRGLIVRVGQPNHGDRARIVWIRLEGGQALQFPLDRPAAADFRAPTWSTHHNAATFACDLENAAEIVIQSGPSAQLTSLARTGPAPAFLWNREGDRLAFASRSPAAGGAYSGLSIYKVNDASLDSLTEDAFLAFFWCPDGRRILYVVGEMAGRMAKLQLLDIETHERSELGWFRPSRDVLLMLGHFDQYSQSAHLFSPDGDEIVLAASIAQELKNGSVPTVRDIVVRSVAGDEQPQVKTHGRLAFWRPAPS
jgi:Tol biopolymer transport system component